MTSFALVTEGETDQVVLENIIQTIYLDAIDEEVDIRPVQPLYDETSKSRREVFGGWEQALEFCASKDRLLEALSINDFLVIHLDSDICSDDKINIPFVTPEGHKSTRQIIEDMKSLISSRIPIEVYEEHRSKIIFAIAVHSTECWLLPLHARRDGDKSQMVNCENRLRRALAEHKVKYVKDARSYEDFSRAFRKINNIQSAQAHCESLDDFIDTLQALIQAR